MELSTDELKIKLRTLERERDRLIETIERREQNYYNQNRKQLYLENQILKLQLQQLTESNLSLSEQNKKLKVPVKRSRLFDW